MGPFGGSEGREWKEGSSGAEEPGKAEVAPTASLNGMRRSEKAEVLENASPDIQGLRSFRTSEHTFTYKHTHIMHTITRLRLAYPLRCRGYRESSTNKQHALSHK